MSVEQERWTPIPGLEGSYEVSTLGRVRSLDRSVAAVRNGKPWMMRCRGRVLLLKRDKKTGYLRVQLGRDGPTEGAHRLVLFGFVGPCPEGHEGAHGDGVRDNNRLENLRWATGVENQADRRAHGTALAGEMNPAARLSAAAVSELRRNAGSMTQTELGAAYGVSQAHVSKIIRGENWR